MADRARTFRPGGVQLTIVLIVVVALVKFSVMRALHTPFWTYPAAFLVSAGVLVVVLRYRTLLKRQQFDGEALRESEQLFRNVFQEASVGMIIIDTAGRVESVNRGFADLLHYSAEELTGKSLFSYIAPEHHADVARDRAAVLSGKVRSYRAERTFIRKDGASVWVRTSVSPLEIGGKRHTVTLVEDITERKQLRERLWDHAMHDSLTGLPNRREFEQALDIALAVARSDAASAPSPDGTSTRRGSEVALLYVDLDGFKLVNDTMGHRFGDLLLKEVAGRLKECLEERYLLARVGGDEFTIVLTGIEGVELPSEIAKSLLASLNAPLQIDGHQISVSASIGISRYPMDGGDSSALLQSADAAMYSAKRSGNNRYRFFTAQLRQDAHQRLTIENHLRRALDNREISIAFQPLYELASGRLVCFEALCRWTSPTLGEVTPDRFIAIAEETGMIHRIGGYVMRQACLQALQWQFGATPVEVAVNVSAVQFARSDFVKCVVDVLRETGLKPGLLELELTESSLVRDSEDGIRKMAQLKNLGVRIAIDDFGTGYSSLSYLQNMPVDSLKIDRAFTAKLGVSQNSLSMVRAIIAMARALGIRVVTEGVENSAQVEILRMLGTDDVQGYFYGRPEDAVSTVERVMRELVMPEDSMATAEGLIALDAATSREPVTEANSSQPSFVQQQP